MKKRELTDIKVNLSKIKTTNKNIKIISIDSILEYFNL